MFSNQSNVLEILTTVVVTITSFMVIVKTMKLSTKKELFQKVYFPLYKILQPFLYKNLSLEELESILSEINNSFEKSQYLPFDIEELIDLLQKGFSEKKVFQETYTTLCRRVDLRCNRLCSLLGYPKRNFKYKIQHKQFENRYLKWFYISVFFVTKFIVFAFFVVFGLTIAVWLKILISGILLLPLQ